MSSRYLRATPLVTKSKYGRHVDGSLQSFSAPLLEMFVQNYIFGVC